MVWIAIALLVIANAGLVWWCVSLQRMILATHQSTISLGAAHGKLLETVKATNASLSMVEKEPLQRQDEKGMN